ncbi:hypothetical protein KUL152_32520 [Tenacibaculum sp. KUL152]|nr:hypothetical protein KUL152_32520 [Tenacibaculum sp. KUL152]GFD94587.1 hypothetical protein KUL154_33200 [Alteromonas sp. KUL154]GFE03283.1 hypothetical protein KUL156_58750 [Alteromonas sp. KUL156]
MNHDKKRKFDLGGESYRCNLHYRSYDIDAFDELKDNNLEEAVIVTYTSAKALDTVFAKIQNTFKAAKKVTLVLGFHHPLDETESFKSDLGSSLLAVKLRLESSYWQTINLDFTLHNHCHIKYIQAGPFCFAGSQNFTGTIAGTTVDTKYPKNELIISVLESAARLQQISKELLLCLHHESDEFIQLSKSEIFSDQRFPENAYAKLREARISSKSRQPHSNLYRLLEHEAYQDALREFHEEVAQDLILKEKEIPQLLRFYQQIESCFSEHKYPAQNEEDFKLEAMVETLTEIENYIMASPISDAIETVIEEFQPVNFSGRIQVRGLSSASESEKMFNIQLHQAIQDLEYTINQERLLQLKMELYESALESLKETLSKLGLEDEYSFKQHYADEMISNVVDNMGSAPEYVEESRVCPDSLTETAANYVYESLPNSELLQCLGSLKEYSIQEQIEEAMTEHSKTISCE